MEKFRYSLVIGLAAVFCAAADEAPAKKAADVVADFFAKRKALEAKTEKEIGALQQAATKELLALHDALVKAKKAADAERVLAQLVLINTAPKDIIDNPANLTAFTKTVGRQVVLRVTGGNGGTVWGTGVYTADSSAAAAAVHSGMVRLGERALVLATMVLGRETYQGTARNGVTSRDYGKYGTSYQLLRIGPAPVKEEARGEN